MAKFQNRIFNILWIFFLCSFYTLVNGQETQFSSAIGSWSSHLPYQNARWVTQSDDKVIFSTEWSILSLDKTDFSFSFLSKVDGLSDVGIDRIQYDKQTEQLIIAYGNSNIDLVHGADIINIPDIKQNTTLQGDKRIYDILVNQGKVYFSTGFGIVRFDLENLNFGFTTFTGIAVNDAQIIDDQIFIATDDGIYFSNLEQANLVDFNNWELLASAYGMPVVYSCAALGTLAGQLYAAIDGRQLHKINIENQTSQEIFEINEVGFINQYISSEGSKLILGIRDHKASSKALFFDKNDNYITNGNLCDDRTLYSIEDQNGRIWYADEWNDMRYSENFNESCKRLKFDSPFSHETSDLATKGGQLFAASGGATESFLIRDTRVGFYLLENNDWINWNQDSFQPIKDKELLNFYQILPAPNENKLYLGTYGTGLVKLDLDNENLQVFDQDNSSIGGVIGDESRERITGLAFDDQNQLWISNFGAERPLSVYNVAQEKWQSFSKGDSPSNFFAELDIDPFGYKWVRVFGQNGGLFVFDDNNTPFELGDDQQTFYNSSNSELTTNEVRDVVVDLDGSVWVATAEGPVIFDCGFNAFDESCMGRKIKVLQDSIAAFLLADVDITTIEIDGANRKWFGSQNGIFVQSTDGITQELRFTTKNSPLFDDNIISLAFNQESGEMFIATDKGIQSYRTKTTGAKPRHASEVFAFPNPVTPDYHGPIAIKGLARDAEVKITDINGLLVAEARSLGGQAIWDGRDLTGQRAAAGVYLVFSTGAVSFDTPDSFVTKILFVR